MIQLQKEKSDSKATQPAPPSRKSPRKLPWHFFVVPASIVVIWQVAVATGALDSRLVPSPITALRTWEQWCFGGGGPGNTKYNGQWWTNAWASTQRVMIGFAIASVAGIVVGLLIGWFRMPRLLLQPVIDLLRPIPVTAWVPFTVVFFGIGGMASISLIALGAFFAVALNTAAGAQQTPRVLISAASMLGTSKRSLVYRVVLPSALPSILTGLRLAMSLSWVLVIVSEMVAVKSGLGFALWDAYYYTRTDVIVAAMFSVGLLGYVSDRIIVGLSNRVIKWGPRVH